MLDPKTRLVEKMGRLYLYLQPQEQADDYQVPVTQLNAWLDRYYHWYLDAGQIMELDRFYMLSGMTATLIGSRLLDHPAPLNKLIEKTTELGLFLALQVSFDELRGNFSALEYINNHTRLSELLIYLDDDSAAASPEELETVWKQARDLHCKLSIYGHYTSMQRYGCFTSPVLNSDNTIFVPLPDESATDDPMPPFPRRSCSNNLAIHVDSDGSVYPCSGLLGVTGCALGTVFDPVCDLIPANYPMDLCRMLTQGPDIDPEGPVIPMINTPWMCRRHRYIMTEEASHE